MKFSIVVPVYNVQKYITECCNSVLNQTYQNYELILVDDGSTDGSGTICDQLMSSEPDKIKVLHISNKGPLLARREGIRASTGDVIVSLDSDDCIQSELLNKLFRCFEENQCDMVLYNASKKADYSSKDCCFPFKCRNTCSEVSKYDYCQKMASSDVPNSLCLKAVTRECVECLPDFSDFTHVKNGDDLLLSLYMITAAEKIIYLDETLYFYRQHEKSIVHSFNPNRANSIKTVHREFERFIDLWNMPQLHPAHYTREVKGWIETLLILMANKENMDSSELSKNLKDMAEDEYFRCAYDAMDAKRLNRRYRLLAKWLYRKWFFLLRVADFLRAIKHKVKNCK